MKKDLLQKNASARKNSGFIKSCIITAFLIIIGLNISYSQVTKFPNPPNAIISSVFQLSAGGQSIPVYKYMDYHYAHFSLAGTANFKVTASAPISTSKISPLSLEIPGTVSGNDLSFPLTQIGTTDQTPLYLVIQINSLEKLVILADKPEVNVPASSGSGIYNVTASPYNADKTGANYTQPAIQQAIDDASSAGGGIVYVPAGIYKVKENLSVKSNVTLYMAPGSVLKAIDIRSEYPQVAAIEPLLIVATGASNVTIRGRGEIDASGFKLMNPNNGFTSQSIEHPRRRIVQIDSNENVTFDGIMLKDASGWSMDLRSSNNVICQNVKVLNHKDNNKKIENDGIDMTSSSNSKVNQCFVITIDDAMCAKARYGDMTNVEFSNNVNYSTAAGVKAGMQSVGNMSNIVFRNCDVINSRRGIGVDTKEGNLPITGVVFKDIRVEYSRDNCIEFFSSYADIKDIDIINCNCHTDNRIDFSGAENITNVRMQGLVLKGNAINSYADADLYADITSGPNDTYSFGPSADVISGTKYEAEEATLTNGTILSGATGQYVDLEAGGQIQWNVNAGATANYTLAFSAGVGSASTRKMGVYVNGTKRGVITSSYIGFAPVSIVAPLNQGSNTIELRDSEGTTELNVDFLAVSLPKYEAEAAVIDNGVIASGATGQYVNLEGGGKLTWTVPAVETASYMLAFNVSTYSAGTRSMGVYVNGTKRGVVTSSLINFTEIIVSAALNQGNNTIELRDSEGTAEFDVDYLKVLPVISQFEAEEAAITNGEITNGGTGKYVNLEAEGKLVWNVPVPSAGTQTLTFKVAVLSPSTRKMGVYVNGTKAGVITSSILDFTEQSISASLIQGNNIIELRDSEGTAEFNVDYLSIPTLNTQSITAKKSIQPQTAVATNSVADESFFIFPNPVSDGIINIELNGNKYNSLQIFTSAGTLVYSTEFKGKHTFKIDIGPILKTGLYLVSLKSDSTISTKTLIVK